MGETVAANAAAVGALGADVVVIGAGPAGAATAITCARSGLSVIVCEKSALWPRSKTCGDGLTPRAVRMFDRLGVPIPASWHRQVGGSSYGTSETPHPFPWATDMPDMPAVSYAVPRALSDAALMATAVGLGVRFLTGAAVTSLVTDATGRAAGVHLADGRVVTGRVVVDASGAVSRFGDRAGLPRRLGWPMAVAVRGYVAAAPGQGPDETLLHSWLAPRAAGGQRLTGYGWAFPLGGGLFNVGIGQLSTAPTFRRSDYRTELRGFVEGLPASWGLRWVEEPWLDAASGRLTARPVAEPAIRGAGLPMGFDRRVAYRRGLLLTGDAAGLVNPWNGEGVSYALESGELAGQAILAASRATGSGSSAAAESALQGYHHALKRSLGDYYATGRAFARLVGHPGLVEFGLRHILPRAAAMAPVDKMMSNLYPAHGGGPLDRTLRGIEHVVGAL